MKRSVFAVLIIMLLALPLLGGCGLRELDARLDKLEDAVEQRVDAAEDRVEAAVIAAVTADSGADAAADTRPDSATDAPTRPAADGQSDENEPLLTRDEAQTIALEHAGLAAEQVSRLRVELDRDDGRLQYEVQFYADRWEYEYDIHAETGKILSFDRDD